MRRVKGCKPGRTSYCIDLRRVFLRYVNISMCKFRDSVSCPGLYGGLYGQNLPYKFKNSYGDFEDLNFEKSHTAVELLVPGQILDRICDPEQILVQIRPPEFSKTKVFG